MQPTAADTAAKISAFTISRRAYSKYVAVETFEGTWVDAQLRAMALQAARNDGEYDVYFPGEELGSRGGSNCQSGMDWL